MRVIPRILLDRLGGTSIGIAFAEDGINRATLDLVITRLDFLFLVTLGLIRIVRKLVSLALQLRNGRLQLRDRRADIRQLDDVRFRCGRQIAELGERIAELLIGGEILRKIRHDAARQRDVPGLNSNASMLGKCLNNGEKGIGRESRRFVGLCINDSRTLGHDRRWKFSPQTKGIDACWSKAIALQIPQGAS